MIKWFRWAKYKLSPTIVVAFATLPEIANPNKTVTQTTKNSQCKSV